MKLSRLMKDVKCLSPFDGEMDVEKIAETSKDVKNNSLFIAIEGEKTDGHRFIDEAKKNGAICVVKQKGKLKDNDILVADCRKAAAIIWRNFYENPSEKLNLTGVTGTNGKTTVTYLTRHILEFVGRKTGIIGTVANIIGESADDARQTTPPPSEIHGLFKKMTENEITDVCMEVSSHSLIQNRVYGLKFKAGAFTNLTLDHLDYHKTLEEYLRAKLKLVDLCEGFAINIDDPYGSFFLKKAKDNRLKTITFGIKEENSRRNYDIMAVDLIESKNGTGFKIVTDKQSIDAYINIPGRFSVYNALTAVSLAILNGVSLIDAAAALEKAKGIKGRMETINIKKDYTIIIDYAHTPDGLENVLNSLNNLKENGKIITVFGCGGDRDKTKRPIMGAIACKKSDLVIITSDNPRSEEPITIIEDILKGIIENKTPVIVIEDRKTAIRTAMEKASRGDIVLIAGKGHETYQILKDKTISFDEREIIKAIG